jgi:hypothetical protein
MVLDEMSQRESQPINVIERRRVSQLHRRADESLGRLGDLTELGGNTSRNSAHSHDRKELDGLHEMAMRLGSTWEKYKSLYEDKHMAAREV